MRCPGGQVWGLAAGLLALAVPGRVWGYSSPSLYTADPVRAGGGGGRVFTGAPADGLECSVCHRGGAAPTLRLEGGPGEVYAPGATYQFELRWAPGQHLGLAAEAADPSGAPLGALRVASGDDLLDEERCAGGGAAATVLAIGERGPVALGDCGATRLRLQWTAPMVAAEGDLYVTMVLGDGEGTPEHDGAVAFTVPLRSGEVASGCAVAGGGGWWWWVVLIGWRRRGLWAVALLAAVAGCKRVQPHERGRLAQPDMQLTPDPELTAGPEHALDYREGAAGGLGGGGGGCGCN